MFMKTGELIREQRKLKGLTQRQLAEAIGASEPSIRLYELGKRTPNEDVLKKIAKVLAISPSALRSYEVSNVREALEMLFRLEEEYGLEPFVDDGAHGLSINHKAHKAPKISMAIETWADMRRQFESGEITEAEYAAWKASFRG